MRFHFQNLGHLDDADVTLNRLTMICGRNNTGKNLPDLCDLWIYAICSHFTDYGKSISKHKK